MIFFSGKIYDYFDYAIWSVTGANIRKLLLLTKKDKIECVTDKDIDDIIYEAISDDDLWKVDVIHELTDVKFGQLNIEGFDEEECEEILRYVCTSWPP